MLMKILSDESRFVTIESWLMVWRCKDIKLSATLQDEQVGGIDNKIERLNISEIKKSGSSDDTSAGFPQLIHWCVAVASTFSVLILLFYQPLCTIRTRL